MMSSAECSGQFPAIGAHLLKHGLVRHPVDPTAFADHGKSRVLQFLVEHLDRFAAPAEAAERGRFLALEFGALDQLQNPGNRVQVSVVDGRRPP